MRPVRSGIRWLGQNLVSKDPLVPDIHAGIAGGRPGQVRFQVQAEWPGEEERRDRISQDGPGVLAPRGREHEQ
jgi:hypothetical protein